MNSWPCAWAQYAPPSVRVPAGPNLTFQDSDFKAAPTMAAPGDYLRNGTCIGTAPDGK